MRYYFTEFKYWIADRFFTEELDEAFNLGLKEGARRQRVTHIIDLKAHMETAAKSNQPGIKLAIKLLGGN
jgi:hypothetical protein